MAFEQNPYAVKISLTADNTLNSTITNGVAATTYQFRFVKVAAYASAAFTGITTVGSASITSLTVANSAGIVTGAPISGANVPSGAFITGITYSGASITGVTMSSPATAAGTATVNVTPSSQPNGNGPVATSVTATTDRPIGILQNQPTVKLATANSIGNPVDSYSEAEITISGISKVVAGGVINSGDPIRVDATGRAVTGTFSTTASTGYVPVASGLSFIVGTALTTASAAGEVITIALSAANAVRNV
jgi:hypothetical protein